MADPKLWPQRVDISSPKTILQLPEVRVLYINSHPEFGTRTFNLHRLQHILARIFRFFCGLKKIAWPDMKTYLTATELQHALNTLIASNLAYFYPDVVSKFKKKEPLPMKHPLFKLQP